MAQKGVKIGQNRLFEWLRSNGYICTRNGNKNYPTQRSIEHKLLEVIERTVTKPDGSALSTFTTKVTGKGQVFFVNKFLEQES
jgi:anti-repressor protein